MVKNGIFKLLPSSSGKQWQFYIAMDIQWSRMAISHYYCHHEVKNGNFTYFYWYQVVKKTILHCHWQLVVKNDNFTLLLTSSGQQWQFHIATGHLVVNNGNFTLLLDIQWSRMAISHYLLDIHVVTNGNFTLLLSSTGQQWHFQIATDIKRSRMAISHCHWKQVV